MNNTISNILPNELIIKHNYVIVDGRYVLTLYIKNFPKDISVKSILFIQNILKEGNISIFVKRLDKKEIVKRLTEVIASNKGEINSNTEEQADVDLINSEINQAKDLRRKIQVDNEDIYSVNVYISLTNNNQNILLEERKLENILYSKGIEVKPLNFRQRQGYLSTLPLLYEDKLITIDHGKIFTETNLVSILPLYNENKLNKEAVIIGKADESLCSLDIFSNNNMNSNMCVFGSSGTGKSFFIKSLILKYLYKGTKQIIIDPEGEYVELVKNLGGIIKSDCKEIEFKNIEHKSKINKMFVDVVKSIIYSIEYSKSNKIELKIFFIEYIIKNQTNFINKIYRRINTLKTGRILTDSIIKEEIKKIITKSVSEDNNIENSVKRNISDILSKDIFFDEILVCYDLSSYKGYNLPIIVEDILKSIDEKLEDNTIIYIDEFWKCIDSRKDAFASSKIFNMYKTIRKKKAGIICATQDITDILSNNNMDFGKSLINNSFFKVYFRMDLIEREIFERLGILDMEKLIKIKNLERGHAYINAGNINFNAHIIVSEYEKLLIEGRNNEKYNNSSTK